MIQVAAVCILALVAACFALMLVIFALELRDIWRYWHP